MKTIYSLLQTSLKRLLIVLLSTVLSVSLFAQQPQKVVPEPEVVHKQQFHYFFDTHYNIINDIVNDILAEAPLTIFIPSLSAFDDLTTEQKKFYFKHPYLDLIDLLKGHVVSGKYSSSQLSDGMELSALNGNMLNIAIDDEAVYVNETKVKRANFYIGSSVIHVIDQVIIPEMPVMPATVYEIIENSEDHTILEAAINAAELDGALMGEGPFTVFAPTDAAFDALPEGTVAALLEDPTGDLAQILLYHVVGAKAMSADLSDGQMIATLQGKEVKVSIMDGKVYINDAMVSVADIEADNGVVHVIDAVLIPPTTTVYDVIMDSEDHTTLEAAINAAELDGALMGEGPFTVFAPTDAAFDALPEGTVAALLEDPTGDLAQILLYHVVGAKAMSTDLSDGQMIATLQGKEVKVSIMDGKVYINDAMVSVADIEADNGVVHEIDAVMIPPTTTVYDVIMASENHTTLEAAISAAELDGALMGEGPFTVFAPTDAAFDALPEGTVAALLEDPTGDLAQILLYHVVGAKAMSTDLSDGQMIATLQGKEVKVSIMDGKVYINDVMVSVADIEADNGVVHVIDAVLIPPVDVKLLSNAMYGDVLVDGEGNTLYFFTKDADGSSMCIDGCLDNWPVFYAQNPALGEGLDEDDFAHIDRGDGVMQTTYKGWPLYYFAGDTNPGETKGEGVGNKWFVAKPDYTIMLVDNQLTGLDGNNYKGDYTPGDEIIQYFTDDKGNTIYTWVNDDKDKNNFTAADFSNNAAWPIYEEDDMVVPSTLDKEMFGTIDVFGKTQLTYNGWPLYFFGKDMMRGDNKGVSVPKPGIWPVAQTGMMPPTTTVYDVIMDSEDHTTLEAAINAAELDGALMGEGPFTVFAPTDAAFDALPEGTVAALLEDPSGDLAQILLYHVVGAKAMSTDLSDGQMIATLQGKEVKVSITDGKVYINDAMVSVADIEADNGVVHVIDAVLIPPTTTVYDVIMDSEDHTILEAAINAAELDGALMGEGPFTVFAPTDAAFDALPEGTVAALLEDPTGDLAQILLYHVVGAKAMSTDLSDGQMIATLQGKEVKVSIMDGKVYINDAMVSVADIEADNGVVHVIDAVLIPPTTTVYDVIMASEDHTILEAAINAAELDGALMGEGPFTVFAPTDAAFDALPEGTVAALLEDPTGELAQILLYHVVGAKAMSTDLSDGQMIATLQGENVTVSIMKGVVKINNALVSVADIMTENGVVHVIDAVLLPPSITSVDDEFKQAIFSLSPNPASSHTRVIFDNTYTHKTKLSLYTVSGKLVFSEFMNDSETIVDLSQLSKGLYFVVLESNGNKRTEKLIVN
ncbi:Por secretion system C-terminal sorting domain-containing protein [Saccharicrinis carchari]|uniref:Por secretion system C-terminal sorting domain-containing protein n=1 Tax=Saccharicrinis carchari TaxID=1168039 RepID=A0A521ASM6_SACCC|nr:fasciclin domain-containing protein [Saccharicrinis carchari]SMO37799.1 Por secretion system C-terminal sorting domain-containing protein [Saccharicrinis carchari]